MSKEKLLHPPTGNGQGKWESKNALRTYLKKRKAKNKAARVARRRGR